MSPSTRGALWMILASFCFAWMGLGVKVAARSLSVAELVFWRNATTFAVLLAFVASNPRVALGHNRPLLVARAVVGVCSMYAYFQGITRLPLGDAILITYTSPMWVAALSPWVLGERPDRAQWASLALGLFGVALVVSPTGGAAAVGAGWAVAAALLSATAYVLLRRLTRTDTGPVVLLWFSGLSTAITAPAALTSTVSWDAPLAATVAGIGVLGLASQLAMTRGFSLGPAATMAVYTYSTPLFAYAFGVTALGEVPSAGATAGALLVLAAGVASWRRSSVPSAN